MTYEFFVNIVDSPSSQDIYNNISEGKLLRSAIRLNNIDCIDRVAIDKASFHKAIFMGFLDGINRFNKVPVLHISCHGSQHGIKLSCGEIIKWEDLSKVLIGLNKLLSGKLVLCMSSCEGFNVCQMAMIENIQEYPFFAIIGNKKKPTWADTAIAYSSFYHLCIKGYNVYQTVECMKAASGNSDWSIITAEDANKAFINHISEIKLQEVLQKLKAKYGN